MGCLIGILGMFMLWGILLAFVESPVLGILALVGLVALGYLVNPNDKQKKKNEVEKKRKKLNDLEKNVKDFAVSQKLISHDLETELLLDEENKRIAFLDQTNAEIYPYGDIIESEILLDGNTVIKTSRSSQIGGALIGGVLAGGVGAIIGGLSGEKKTEQEVFRVDLKVIVNNPKNPIKIINFLKADVIDIDGKPLPLKKDSPEFINANNSVNHWHSLLSLVIKKEEEKTSEPKYSSLADELKKLSELHKDGILTEEEFQQQKHKLLS